MFGLLSSAVQAVLGGEDDLFDLTTAETVLDELNQAAVSAEQFTYPEHLPGTAEKSPGDSLSDDTTTEKRPVSQESLRLRISDPSLINDVSSVDVAPAVTEEEAMLDVEFQPVNHESCNPGPDEQYYAKFTDEDGTLGHVLGHMASHQTVQRDPSRIEYPDTTQPACIEVLETSGTIEVALQSSCITISPFKSLKEIIRDAGLPEDGQSIIFEDVVHETVAVLSPVVTEESIPAPVEKKRGARGGRNKKRTPVLDVPQESAMVSSVEFSTSLPTLSQFDPPEADPSSSSAPKWYSWTFGSPTLTEKEEQQQYCNCVLGPSTLTGEDYEFCSLPVLRPAVLTSKEDTQGLALLGPTELATDDADVKTQHHAQTLKWTAQPQALGISRQSTGRQTCATSLRSHRPGLEDILALFAWFRSTKPVFKRRPKEHGSADPHLVNTTVQSIQTTSRKKPIAVAVLPTPPGSSPQTLTKRAPPSTPGIQPECSPPTLSKSQRKARNKRARRAQEAQTQSSSESSGAQQKVATVKIVTEDRIQALKHVISSKAMLHLTAQSKASIATLPFRIYINSTIEAYSYASMVYASPDGPLAQEFGAHHLVMWSDASNPLYSKRLQALAVVYRHHTPLVTGQEPSGWQEWAFTGNLEDKNSGRVINTLETTAVHMALGIGLGEVDRRRKETTTKASSVDVTKLTIFTDSQNTLTGLLNGSLGQLGASIVRYAELLVAKGVAVDIRWVPGHAGVAGNEAADRLALLASQFGPVPQREGAFVRVPVPLLRMCERQYALAEVMGRGENQAVLKPFLELQRREAREALGRAGVEEGWVSGVV